MRSSIWAGDGRRRKNKRPSNDGKRNKAMDWKKYNQFRKDEYRLILPIVAEVVNKAEQPYKVKRRRKAQPEHRGAMQSSSMEHVSSCLPQLWVS